MTVTVPLLPTDLHYGAAALQPATPFIKCPQCERDSGCPHCGVLDCPECESFTECEHCGYSVEDVHHNGLDPIDDEGGLRPDEWAQLKGHLVVEASGKVDWSRPPWELHAAAALRKWPNPEYRPDYRISEAAYDAAIENGKRPTLWPT